MNRRTSIRAEIHAIICRFSNKTPVPMLGGMNSTLAEIETFYDFWYNFDSWRSFEYFDKEDADSTEKYVLRKMNHSVQ